MDLLTDFSQNSLLIASISCATFLILKLFAVIALKFVALGEYEKVHWFFQMAVWQSVFDNSLVSG
jgi:hypothetical protein